MSIAVESLGFFMAALGLLMLGVTLPNSYWRVSTVHGNVITTNTIFENLWYSCATDSLGVSNCWEFPSMLALSGYVQGCRALMITAILLGFLGLFLGILGLRCTKIGSMELSRKAKVAAIAGALDMLAGACGMVAISWYAVNITQDFFNPLYVGTNCCCASQEDPTARAQLPYKTSTVVMPTATSDEGDSSFGKYGKNAYV
ncbi:claudin-15 isoform X2 [Marmota monax]|uniref:claudin-15 isoform X2 n=1 Tax=Marmota monax TaxID=9995 RepID=UPI001EB0582E|nr:claudin-15 isoform X2 [Marmota monax]XP_048645943.1 claudin-15 isoform X2 [Marmota marmota marmota]